MQALALMKPKKGETLFISGGTGSLGAMAIPVAKSYGLTVITNGNGASEERVRRLGADRFIDYKKEDYAKVLSNVDYVLDTLGNRELEKEFSILKDGGSLVSLRGMPNGEFAARTGMSMIKRLLLKVAGRKYDQMAARRNQKYYFVFVHEDGAALERISEIFGQNHLEASVDGVFSLDDVNEALIIEEGVMWGAILDILIRKAQAGIDVRVLYDGMCEIKQLPGNYHKLMEERGIKTKAFCPILPIV